MQGARDEKDDEVLESQAVRPATNAGGKARKQKKQTNELKTT
jgi:hypothetical protein